MNWWESNPSLTPVFTLDTNSTINSNYVHFVHNKLLRARVHQGAGRVYPSIYTYFNQELNVALYKTLKFNDVELILDTPIIIPDNFTFILKVKVHKSSLFLSNNGASHGLTYGTGDTNQPDYNGLWRVEGYIFPSDGKLEAQRLRENNHLMFEIILQGNLITGDASMTVNGDKRSIPIGSNVFGSFLRRGQTFSTIGYNHGGSTWGIKADVVAYGLFAGQVSDSELTSMFETIDTNFLKKQQTPKTINISQKNFEVFEEPLILNYLKNYSYIWNISEPRFRFFNYNHYNVLFTTTINILYKETFDLVDQVFEQNEPVAVKVFLYDRVSGQLLKTTTSNEFGWFQFLNLDKTKEYIVRSSDDKKQFKSILKDYNQ